MMKLCSVQEAQRSIVCIDSYENGIMKGCFFNSSQGREDFNSLSQFLLKMEEMLDTLQTPQAYTSPRSFSELLMPDSTAFEPASGRMKASFELRVVFRQHSSWQGTLFWREKNRESSFRSVLELVRLMDSALRSLEAGGAA